MQHVLFTSRLCLRPYGPDDWPHAHRILSDPAVMWWRKDDPMSEAEIRERLDDYAGPRGAGATGFGWWLIFERSSGALAGQAGLLVVDALGATEVSYRLLPEMRGKGYATEAARALLRHGFLTQGRDEIVALIVPENAASLAVAQRLGMTKAGECMQAARLHHLFRIDRSAMERA